MSKIETGDNSGEKEEALANKAIAVLGENGLELGGRLTISYERGGAVDTVYAAPREKIDPRDVRSTLDNIASNMRPIVDEDTRAHVNTHGPHKDVVGSIRIPEGDGDWTYVNLYKSSREARIATRQQRDLQLKLNSGKKPSLKELDGNPTLRQRLSARLNKEPVIETLENSQSISGGF